MNDLRRTTTAHPRTSRVVASATESVMSTLASTRRPLAGVALLILAACQGDPITAIDPAAAPALAIAPGVVTITDLGLPAGLTDIYPTAINEAGIVLAADAAGGYIYRVGVWSEFIGPEMLPASPRAINDLGDIVANTFGTMTDRSVPFLRRGDVTT